MVRIIGNQMVACQASSFSFVMPALVTAIHAFLFQLNQRKTWMAGMNPAMTKLD
jgi:hypothetical protein